MNLSGNPLDYLLVFAGGVLVSFSPCVYPLLPASLSYIGVTASKSKSQGFILSLVYVTGLAFVYSILGMISALSGSLFGMVSAHPLTRIIVGGIFIVFGLSLLGFFSIKIVDFSPKFRTNDRKKALGKVFLLGASSGLVISPCTSPILGSILVIVAAKGSLVYGVTLLLTFAYGIGFIFILGGTCSAILLNLPKAGEWMSRINKFCAAVLITAGIYFIITSIIGL
jgi:cytochrome c-type biogenesis protein